MLLAVENELLLESLDCRDATEWLGDGLLDLAGDRLPLLGLDIWELPGGGLLEAG